MAVKEHIIENYTAGTLPDHFVKQLRGHRRDELGSEFRAALIELHNDGTIDVLEAARGIAASPISQTEFFLVQDIYVDIIPKLDETVPAMLAAVKALGARGGADLAAGRANDAFRAWAELYDRARATIATVDFANPEDAPYVYLALSALAETEPDAALDQALDILAGQDTPARAGAAKAIGILPVSAAAVGSRLLGALDAARVTCSNDNLLGHIIVAAANVVRKAPAEEPAVVKLIEAAAGDIGDAAIHQIVLMMMSGAPHLPSSVVNALIPLAHKIKIENGGTLDLIDATAAQLLRHGRVDEALALVGPLISAHAELSSLEQLDSLAHALLELDRQRLAAVIAAWLLSLDHNLGAAAQSLVMAHHGDALELGFDAAALALSEAETMLLAYRAVGFLFMYPIAASSMTLSLVPTVSDKGRQAIEDILFEPLLINFSGKLADWLKASDLPLNFHPAAIRASAVLNTPGGAV
ncbi:hypothetical protein GR215_31820 [Rhizobium leguminosarum]|uniref:hypothetical protein n=1 Tax=Rhizobium leguminosarum TaxID=384 RepID=UPI0013BC7CA6|nr:hypothetical protein [Rhizobium leguminosarum]NEH46424.1 hypothetical protein [Rhizobium leguminosarum]